MVHRLRLAALLLLSLALGACSTALLVDTPYDDLEPDADAPIVIDAGRPRDAGAGRDADAGRDAALPRDAGAQDASVNASCSRALPVDGFATLFTSDCAMRPSRGCATQAQLDRELSSIATRCRVAVGVTLGFTVSSSGCPDQLRYSHMSVFGTISQCLQAALEQQRFCGSGCGLITVNNAP